jgi:hypothetical protein
MPTKRVSRKTAMTSCGTHLKKGYKFVKGGGVVKVSTAKASARRKSGAKPKARKSKTTKR